MRHNSELYSLKRSICFSSIITAHLLNTSWKSWSNTKITTCKPPGNQELYKELGFPYPASENWKCKSEITAEIKKKNSGKKISHVLRRWLVWHSLLKTKYWTCCYSSQSTRAGQDKSNNLKCHWNFAFPSDNDSPDARLWKPICNQQKVIYKDSPVTEGSSWWTAPFLFAILFLTNSPAPKHSGHLSFVTQVLGKSVFFSTEKPHLFFFPPV